MERSHLICEGLWTNLTTGHLWLGIVMALMKLLVVDMILASFLTYTFKEKTNQWWFGFNYKMLISDVHEAFLQCEVNLDQQETFLIKVRRHYKESMLYSWKMKYCYSSDTHSEEPLVKTHIKWWITCGFLYCPTKVLNNKILCRSHLN